MTETEPQEPSPVVGSPVEPATATGDVAAQPEATHAPQPLRTRLSATHKGLITGTIVLALLLVFILENTKTVSVSYFGATGRLPLGVALLVAAVAGALLVGIISTARIVQLRRGGRKSRQAGARR